MALYEGRLVSSADAKYALVASRFNDFIVEKLIEGAVDALVRHGADRKNIDIYRAPGGFELPAVVQRVALSEKYQGVVALGCIIRGSTPHFEYIASEAAKGIAHAAMEASCPITFGVLTTDTIEQAIERAGTKAGNKGADAAMALIELVDLYTRI